VGVIVGYRAPLKCEIQIAELDFLASDNMTARSMVFLEVRGHFPATRYSSRARADSG